MFECKAFFLILKIYISKFNSTGNLLKILWKV